MIFVNFKTYKQGTSEEAVKLAKICQEVEKETSIKIIPISQSADVVRIASLGIEVWSQAVVTGGATGVLLNHSDNKLAREVIGSTITKLSNSQIANFKTLVCCESIEEGKEIAKFKPEFLAYEPPELIGGNISVATAKPEIIRDFVLAIPEIPLVIGAGIHNKQDIQVGLKLGAKGFLVSSAVVLAENPREKLLELVGGYSEKI